MRNTIASTAVIALTLATPAIAGPFTTDFAISGNSGDRAVDVVTLPDGRFYVAGDYSDYVWSGGGFVLARYLPNGTLDPTFGTGGFTHTPLDASHGASAIALTPTGGAVVVGYAGDEWGASWYAVAARYDYDGNLEWRRNFFFGATSAFWDVLFDEAGRIVVVGYGGDVLAAGGAFMVAARLDNDGILDPSFAGVGYRYLDCSSSSNDYASAVALTSTGQIVIAGSTENCATVRTDFIATRLFDDGSIDTSFGASGLVTADMGWDEYAADVVIRPDGRILIGGYQANLFFTAGRSAVAFAQVDPSGAFDSTFGTSGKKVWELLKNDASQLDDMLLEPDGRITFTGTMGLRSAPFGERDLLVARIKPNARTVDTTFGTNGVVRYDHSAGPSRTAGTGIIRRGDGHYQIFGEHTLLGMGYPYDYFGIGLKDNGSLDMPFGP